MNRKRGKKMDISDVDILEKQIEKEINEGKATLVYSRTCFAPDTKRVTQIIGVRENFYHIFDREKGS